MVPVDEVKDVIDEEDEEEDEVSITNDILGNTLVEEGHTTPTRDRNVGHNEAYFRR
jgi:hypothetical protein